MPVISKTMTMMSQAAGPSSPEVLEISSRYVEEVVSNSDQEEVSKLAQTQI